MKRITFSTKKNIPNKKNLCYLPLLKRAAVFAADSRSN
jgi:hypothetical protein